MNRRDRRRNRALARQGLRVRASRGTQHTHLRVSCRPPDRRALLLGTALVSAALLGTALAPTPAAAQTVTCTGGPGPGPTPILETSAVAPIICVNTEARTSNGTSPDAINLSTTNAGNYIDLYNSGLLTASEDGIDTYTQGDNSFIAIENLGDVDVDAGGTGAGIRAITAGDATGGGNTGIAIHNSGNFDVETDSGGFGIYAVTTGDATDNSNSGIKISNSGDMDVDADGSEGFGIKALTTEDADGGSNSGIAIYNSGDFDVDTDDGGEGFGIEATTLGDAEDGSDAGIRIGNSGDLDVNAGGDAYGIRAYTVGDAIGEKSNTGIVIDNSGDMWVTSDGDNADVRGIRARTFGYKSSIHIENSGNLHVLSGTGGDATFGINARTYDGKSAVHVKNSGGVEVTSRNDSSARGIELDTYRDKSSIGLWNSGDVTVTTEEGGSARAIDAETEGYKSAIVIDNSGDLRATTQSGNSARGIDADTEGGKSPIYVWNSGDIWVTSEAGGSARGIDAYTEGDESRIDVVNSGDIWATGSTYPSGDGSSARGIEAGTDGEDSAVAISNSGDIHAIAGDGNPGGYYGGSARGIDAYTFDEKGFIHIENSGNITAKGGDGSTFVSPYDGSARGIDADTYGYKSAITIKNSGAIEAIAGNYGFARGIDARTSNERSPIDIWNSGDFKVETTGDFSDADAIEADTYSADSSVTVDNSGDGWVETRGEFATADGIDTYTEGDRSSIEIVNSGNFDVTAKGDFSNADGLDADTDGDKSNVDVHNSGDLWVKTSGDYAGADGIDASTDGYKSGVTIHNSGNLWVETSGRYADAEGIDGSTDGANSPIKITNSGDVHAEAKGEATATGIEATTDGENSPIDIHNSGSVYAAGGYRNVGVYAYSRYANPTTIKNTGTIGAESHLAIDVNGAGTAKINNAGTITGFVDLTEQDDVFNNKSGGVFEAKKTSLFGAGEDLFYNFGGGTVQAATVFGSSEKTFFEGLETFKNAGTISMVDGRAGDSFTIANTPGGTDLKYKSHGGTLAVDSFLGGPGSKSDTFTVQGDVSGTTKVAVSNTNTGPGVFNSTGIPVVFVDGATPSAGNFKLQDGPIDTGFFDYDLFFVPGSTSQWELRSFAGGGAHLLPQLLTAAQDIWHQSSATWFDRTADLRVLMQDGPAPADLGGKSLAAPVQEQLTPAVWLKAGGSWLERDANASTRAYGRNYDFNLDRELETIDVQVGIDFGTRDVLGAGDALVFGVLGGFVHGDLDYDNIARHFQYDGGQIGVYATYLSGGLFVDTLLNAHIYELDANNVAFPGSIDGNTVGLRTDAGYRFGSFSGGVFLEPLATVEVMWADLDGFALGGNRVSFDDEANVRGRLGLRAGTTSEVWEGTLMEPFVIGSVWGNLSDDNAATLVSTGRTFRFVDDPEDVWGEVSAGVNFFNFTQTTSVFGKVDVQFGDDLTGVSGKSGVRVAW